MLAALAATASWIPAVAVAQQTQPAETDTNVQPVSAEAGVRQPLELATGSAAENLASQKFVLPPDKHAWTRFPAGAWREIKITSDSSSEPSESISRSVTTQVEKLKSCSSEQYTLEVQATVNVVGKQVVGPFISRVLNASTDRSGNTLSARRLDDQNLALSLGSLDCEVWELTYEEDSRRFSERLFYCPEQFPFVIRRETVAEPTDPNGLARLERETNVVALEVPYLVGEEPQRCTCLRSVRHGEKGSTVTVSMVSDAVPGGEVAVWTTEFDLQGERTRWSTQTLVSYGLTPRIDKPLTRRELRRARRNR